MTNEENMIDAESIVYDQPLGNSDHCTLRFDYSCYCNEAQSSAPRYQYYKGNYDNMRNELKCENWESLLSCSDIDDKWQKFKDIIIRTMDKQIPKSRGNSDGHGRDRPLWMNGEVRDIIARKRSSWSKYWHSKSYRDFDKYKAIRNGCTVAVRHAKQEYERKIATEAKSDTKSFWKYVHSKTKTKSGVHDLYRSDGSLSEGEPEKVNILNDFFCSVFTVEGELDQRIRSEKKPMCSEIDHIVISEFNVLERLSRLKTDKSPGPDGLHPKVLYELRDCIYRPLTHIFQQTIDTGQVPREWKIANVSPIFKKGDKNKAGNYRPVSLTSIVCKLCESIIRDHIMTHMDSNNLFSEHQYGFRPKRSCTTQLIEVFDRWTSFIDEGMPVDTIYLDFSKAFDTVPHQRLGVKLANYGVGGKIWQWIMSFLGAINGKRKQRVQYLSCRSDWKDVESGVPQGSVLGPILFLIFINDLPELVKFLIKIFADDTKLFGQVVDESQCVLLQKDLDLLCVWSDTWLLKFNITRCKVLHIGKNNPNYVYTMVNEQGREVLDTDSEEKDLGVTFENNLKFDKHITNSVNKANRMLGLIKRTFDYMEKDMFLTLYKSLVRPLLEYATPVWSPYLFKDIRRIERVQRRATKIVSGCRDMEYPQRLRELGIPTLEYRRARNDMVQLYKIISGIDVLDQDQLLTWNHSVTRGHNRKLFKKRCRTSVRKNSFALRIIDPWNKLPEDIVMSTSLNLFKSGLNRVEWNESKFRPSC